MRFITQISKEIFSQKYFWIITSVIMLTNIVEAQENKSVLNIYSNPTNSSYWWLEKNNYGKYIIDKEIEYKFKLKKSNTTYQIDISNAYKKNKTLYFGESFVKHSFSENTFIRAGKYYRDFSKYLNDDLSSGSMLVSKNTQPMPKIGLVHSQKIKKNKNIYFDFGIAHGFFKKNNYYPKAPYLHEKFFYMHIKKNNYQISIGAVHEAMWAGENWAGDLPSTFKDFLKVFIAEDGPDRGGVHTNAIGNHLGIWDFYYQKKEGEKKIKLYYQHFFEDTSSLRFINQTDGLWGIELENYIPHTTFLFEYLDTTHCCINPPYQDDDYYGSWQYLGGWRYEDIIIGNPFVNTMPLLDQWVRNRELTELIHIAIKGKILANDYEIKGSRKINIHDDIKYKMVIGREIKDSVIFKIFLVNNGNSTGSGLGISYLLSKK